MTTDKFFILPIAVLLDLAGLIVAALELIGVGIPIAFLLDAVGTVIIGGWSFLRKRKVAAGKKIIKRFGLAVLGKVISFPSWTILVLTT